MAHCCQFGRLLASTLLPLCQFNSKAQIPFTDGQHENGHNIFVVVVLIPYILKVTFKDHNKFHLLRANTVLDIRDISVNKTNKIPAFLGLLPALTGRRKTVRKQW